MGTDLPNPWEGVIMSTQTVLIIGVVVVVLAIAAIGIVVAQRRGLEQRRRTADALRGQATERSHEAEQARRVAAAREAEAALAESRASQARLEATQTEAMHEDTIHEADQIDPSVDTPRR
jgi:hypothetical protein